MVYVKKVLIKNFKSFGGMAKLNLEPGFNVVTGPNGSGKSNVIDAVQFVLGELGSRRMRVADLGELIYDGAVEAGDQKAQTSVVTVYFDNTDRGLAIDKSLVSVGRKVDRKGSCKYFLNGKRTSRKAVLDLLEMAGISPGGYNVVLQGTATRLSDLTPSERMKALEDLIGITEYDEKKAGAKVRLAEAERKIEVASARIDEVRKRVVDLEAQRNDAIRSRLLQGEERRLGALRLSNQLIGLESEMLGLDAQIGEVNAELSKLEEERAGLVTERNEAKARLEEFNRESAERGNTRLPLLKSDLVAKNTLRSSMGSRLRELEARRLSLQVEMEKKTLATEASKVELEEKRLRLHELEQEEARVSTIIGEKDAQLREDNDAVNGLRGTAERNQLRVEELTDSLVPKQESLSGIEIEVNGKLVKSSSLREKIEELDRKRAEAVEALSSLRARAEELDTQRVGRLRELEDQLTNVAGQVERQRNLRGTIEGASKLAREADTTITQLTAKRDLWEKMVAEEKARERIREMGEAGAISGYHGTLRNLLTIELKYQRAVQASSGGWITAFVFDDLETTLECVERLKKTKLGTTRFLPLKNIKPVDPLPGVEADGVFGLVPNVIRYEETYAPLVKLIWGDTVIVNNRDTALKVTASGYRAVSLSGDVYEAEGGIMGGYYRKPLDFSKLIPSQDSVNELSGTIKALRDRLLKRMGDLKLSGNSLRKFTEFIESSRRDIDDIEQKKGDADEAISRSERNIEGVEEKRREIDRELEQEQGLINTLNERKEKILQDVERTKAEITEIKALQPSDVTGLELRINELGRELVSLQDRRSQLRSDISILANLVNSFLRMNIEESDDRIQKWRQEIEAVDGEAAETKSALDLLSQEIGGLQESLDDMTSDVEATGSVLQQHQSLARQIEQRIEQAERRRENLNRRGMGLSLEAEKIRLQHEHRRSELHNLGYDDKLSLGDTTPVEVEEAIRRVRAEATSLGAINQRAETEYEEYVGNYKQMSVRINELEEEKGSILSFIDEVEQEKLEHFMKAYYDVCENFSGIFAKLTGGGDGRLELQKPEDPFAGGVDLYIQFPGRPMRLASGSSGGERSVAAIAYLLAIQRFLKAPFYLFDEIDAHLDDLNVSKLAEVLRDNSLEAQFVVVTLKDAMVHNAQKIYGVFNQGGRSRILALPLKLEVTV